MTEVNQLFRVVSIWRDFNQNQLIETYNKIIRDLPIKESHWFTSLAIKSNLKTKLWTQTKQGGFGVLGYLSYIDINDEYETENDLH